MTFALLTRGLGTTPSLLITQGLSPDGEIRPAGGWLGYRRRTEEELRRERERLGIVPKEQKKLDRAAKSIAKRIQDESPEEIAQEVMRAKEFEKLMSDITARNAQVMDGLALMLAQAIQARILQELQDEDDAIAMLLLEM